MDTPFRFSEGKSYLFNTFEVGKKLFGEFFISPICC